MKNKLNLIVKNTRHVGTNSIHDYRDFYIDGKSFDAYLPSEDRNDYVSHIGWTYPENKESDWLAKARKIDAETVAVFCNRQKSTLAENRVLIYGCPVDQDPMCGAITADLIETNDEII